MRVRFGGGAVTQLNDELAELRLRRAMFVCTPARRPLCGGTGAILSRSPSPPLRAPIGNRTHRYVPDRQLGLDHLLVRCHLVERRSPLRLTAPSDSSCLRTRSTASALPPVFERISEAATPLAVTSLTTFSG